MDQTLLTSKIKEVLHANRRICLIKGTYLQGKYPVAFISMLLQCEAKSGDYLIRVNDLSKADAVANNVEDETSREFMKRLKSKRVLNYKHSTVYLDTPLRVTQSKTPAKLSGALIYCAEVTNPSEVEELLNKIEDGGFLYLPTWADNTDLSWLRNYNPYEVIVNDPDPESHKAILSLSQPNSRY